MTVPARIAFLGTPEPAAAVLAALAADDRFEIASVVTNPDRPAGRRSTPVAPAVKQVAIELGLPVLQPERARDLTDDFSRLEIDAAAVVAYGSLLPRPLLDTAHHGFVNLHYSLLPRWRGAAPVQHAIRAGDPTTGVTAFRLDEGMDTGPVLRAAATDIGLRETAGELLERLTALGTPVLADALLAACAGEQATPQAADGATLAPKITPDDVRIDWTRTHLDVDRLCRSADPRPGAHTTFRARRLKVFGARPVDRHGQPGVVIDVDEDGPIVGCSTGAVRLDDVQPDGRGRMAGRDFMNGQRVDVGESMGAIG